MKSKNRPSRIGIVDYGMGNIRSVTKAIDHLGGCAFVSDQSEKLNQADALILPGVGEFGHAVRELKNKKLFQFLREWIACEKPLLGICLGLQLLFERSEESQHANGLGVWKGTVRKFKFGKTLRHKIPHMGWNDVRFEKPCVLTKSLSNNSHFYFVHSYYVDPKDKRLTIGTTHYGTRVPAILASQTTFGVQFHPEKSQKAGLKILKNFIGFVQKKRLKK